MTYWSQTPYKLGHGAVKYLVTPSAGAAASASPLGIVARLSARCA